MRRVLIITVLALVGAGCASKGKKESTAAPATKSETKTAEKATTQKTKEAVKPSTASATASSMKSVCSVKGDERIIDIRTKGSGCEVGYSKFGQESIVASSQNGTDYCQNTAGKIKERLQGAGFECK